MNNKDISKFLPRRLRHADMRSFIKSTSQTLFDEANAEYTNYYIGRKVGGSYQHLSDPYRVERTKVRQDYQLDPSLVIRDDLSGNVSSVLFYEDLLNSLRANGVDTTDHNRIFSNTTYTFAPPIDYDMFVNYGSYYWLPEGAPSIRLEATKEVIEGLDTFEGVVLGTTDVHRVTNGNHIILNDDMEYIVSGVGESIVLLPFDLDSNIPLRVTRNTPSGGEEPIDLFPKEYITIERGSTDESPWTRNNAWYHVDAVFPGVPTTWTFPEFDEERRASRPIIQYHKNIELFNYVDESPFGVDLYVQSNELPSTDGTIIDGVELRPGMIAIYDTEESESAGPWLYEDGTWTPIATTATKFTITGGVIFRGSEYTWDGVKWMLLQHKTENTQEIRFNLYNSDDLSIAESLSTIEGSNFNGVSLFSYQTRGAGLVYDRELGMEVGMKTTNNGSDFVFTSNLSEYIENNREFVTKNTSGVFYKRTMAAPLPEKRFFEFTIRDGSSGSPAMFVNGDEMPTIMVEPDSTYVFDFADSSTTRDNQYGMSFPISIREQGTSNPLVQFAQGKSSTTQYKLSFTDGTTYEYVTRVGGEEIIGTINVAKTTDGVYLLSEYRDSGVIPNKLRETVEVMEATGKVTVDLKYIPLSDRNIQVRHNGILVPCTVILKQLEVEQTFQKGDFIEIEYRTYENVVENDPDSPVEQIISSTVQYNPFNAAPISFGYSDVFNHMGGVIASQIGFVGTTYGNNNFRDTMKDYTVGGSIIKHGTSVIPAMFLHNNDNFHMLRAIDNSRMFYQQFKNQLVVETEEYTRNNDITDLNVMDAFDAIIRKINVGKASNSAFSNSRMLASERGFVDLSVASDGSFSVNFVMAANSVLYVYVRELGLAQIDTDYSIEHIDGEYRITPHTFSLDDIISIRLYESMSPTFCPATPQKLGMLAPTKPRLEIDSTYAKDVLVLIGHDHARTLAFTSVSDFNEGILDDRDRVLLEFENRVYNGLTDEVRAMVDEIIPITEFVSTPFKRLSYDMGFVDRAMNDMFFRWCNDNNIDFSENNTYEEGNPWSYNYHGMEYQGTPLRGHWRGIYTDFYNTDAPHLTPWKMLGFAVKPDWWADTYGSDVSSTNTTLWGDLEEGIIRGGSRENFSDRSYMGYDNPYRREGLSAIIPVDSDGNLLNPIEIGLVGVPDTLSVKSKWSLGDFSPVECAWRKMSDYQFSLMKLTYILRPIEFCSNLWSTSQTRRGGYDSIWEYHTNQTHTNDTYIDGISQWVFDLLRNDNFSVNDEMTVPFSNLDMILSHKVGGFINKNEIRLMSESFSPRSQQNTQSQLPDEDIHLIVYQSKDIREESYSGVIIERVSTIEQTRFVAGSIYLVDDVVYVEEDKSYYKKRATTSIAGWESNKVYQLNHEVQYGGRWYVCTTPHTSTSTPPSVGDEWRYREFVSYEWAVLINPPKAKSTKFKVYGYDISKPYFTVIPSIPSNNTRTITAYGEKSAPISIDAWLPNTRYRKDDMVMFNEIPYRVFLPHTSGVNFDSNNWETLSEIPRSHGIDVEYYADAGFQEVSYEYGTIFDTMEDVVEFLVSYGRYLEKRGWYFKDIDKETNEKKDWTLSAQEFVEWAISHTHEHAVITVSPVSDTIQFKPEHGVVSIINQQNESIYNLLGFNGNPIDISDTVVTRDNARFKLVANVPIYFIKVGVKEYEHTLSINNETIFGDVNYDPILGNRVDRLEFAGTITTEWDGRLYAPGFIITNDGIKPNFDTAMKDITSFNDMSVVSSREVLNELKYHNLGYQKRSYLENLRMDNKAQIDFYSGFIRQKGSASSYNKILRSNVTNSSEFMTVAEEWAFKESVFGGTSNYAQVEFYITEEQFSHNPQPIRLVYNGKSPSEKFGVVNIDSNNSDQWLVSPSSFQESGEMFETQYPVSVYRDAGYALYHEHELKARDFKTLTHRMETTGITATQGMTVWLSSDATNGYSWSIYQLDQTDLVITEIIDGGNDGTNSAVVRANNVHVEMPYGLTDAKGRFRNVTFYHIRDDIYMLVEENEDIFVILGDNIAPSDIGIMQWKPLRIMSDPVSRMSLTVDAHILKYRITPIDGMLLYKDEEFYGMGNWEVYEYQEGTWKSIRRRGRVVNTSLFNDVAVYNKDDMLIDYLRVYDPLQGHIPGARIDQIDIISNRDPVNYEAGTVRQYNSYRDLVGNIWWDTSTLVYVDYLSGDEIYRESYWGVQFPDSEVVIYEWTQSNESPENFDGEVKNVDEYIMSEEFDYELGVYLTRYYFWAKNPSTTNSHTDRAISASQIASSIRAPMGNGFPMFVPVNSYNLLIMDEAGILGMEDMILKVGYKLRETDTKTHTHWVLVPETPTKDDIPSFIFDKMIDSVLGYDIDKHELPYSNLSRSQRYGIEYNQSWFEDVGMAREIFFKKLNAHLSKININNFDLKLSDFGIDIDSSDLLSLVTWESEHFDPSKDISRVLNDRSELITMSLAEGEYVRVIEGSSGLSAWSIYRWDSAANDVERIAQSMSSVQLNHYKLASGITESDNEELRVFFSVLFNEMSVAPYNTIINDLLFTMVRYVVTEQPNNNWVFPTTYISIIEDQVNMVQHNTYRPSTINDVTSYLREAKPYHTKIKNYERINRPENESSQMRVTDFDKPVFVGPDLSLQIIQEKQFDRFEPNGTEYTLTQRHDHEVYVTDDGNLLSSTDYRIDGDTLILNYTPEAGRNLKKSIVVESRDLGEQSVLDTWRSTWGYSEELRDTFDIDSWEMYSIQKHTTVLYDRNWQVNLNSFEDLAFMVGHLRGSDQPHKILNDYSLNRDPDDGFILNTKDRNLVHNHGDEVLSLVDKSATYTIRNGDQTVPFSGDLSDKSVIVNNLHLAPNMYALDGNKLTFKMDLQDGDKVAIRPTKELNELYLLQNMHEDFRQVSDVFASEGFEGDGDVLPILVDKLKTVSYKGFNDSELVATGNTYVFEDGGIDLYTLGEFTDNYNGSNDEHLGLRIHESIIMTSISRVPEFIPVATEEELNTRLYQEEVVIVTEVGRNTYPFNMQVPFYQIKVRQGENILVRGIHYRIEDSTLTLLQDYDSETEFHINDINDVSSETGIMAPDIVRTRRAEGGYYVLEELGEDCDNPAPIREFIIYGKDGRRHLYRTRLYDYLRLEAPTEYAQVFRLDEEEEFLLDFTRTNKMYAIVGTNSEDLEDINEPIAFEIIRGSIKDGEVSGVSRALFNGDAVSFVDHKYVYLYELEYEEYMDTYVIDDVKSGNIDNDNYPKLGHILFRRNALPVVRRNQ